MNKDKINVRRSQICVYTISMREIHVLELWIERNVYDPYSLLLK